MLTGFITIPKTVFYCFFVSFFWKKVKKKEVLGRLWIIVLT